MSDARQQRIEVLKNAARRKSEEKTRSADAAIARLIKRGEPVTFQAVQREAGVSHAFLYNNTRLRARIDHQRRQHRPAPEPTSTDAAADNNIVAALTAEIARLKTQRRAEVTALRAALEQAHGENLELRRQLTRNGQLPTTGAVPNFPVEAWTSVVGMAVIWSNAQVRPMTVDEAEQVATWHYSGDWSVYDLPSAQPIIDNLRSYYAVLTDETLIGFCCIGQAARIPGITKQPATVDVGMGMDPALVGRGHGAAFGRAVLSYLAETYPDKGLRAVVQGWNERSLRLTRRLGFEEIGEITAVQGGRPVAYRIVVKRRQRELISHL